MEVIMKYTLSDLTLIQPSRNNLKYLKWSYNSIRKNLGSDIWIAMADDASTDGTWDWIEEQLKSDDRLLAIRNNTGERWGHTILYDMLVDIADTELCCIWHADMYATPNCFDDALELMGEPNRIVSLTRIEPPLHPDGPEKILHDWGTEPEDFNEDEFLKWLESDVYPTCGDKRTIGVFAPWVFRKSDFIEIGGHDPLYAPQSKEDSDIFNRFHLNGVNFIQTWNRGFVYHMTCRGSRFNPTITSVGTNSDEWNAQNKRSERNFIRKWGTNVRHNELMNPIVPHKYDVGIVLYNPTPELIELLEPFCSTFYTLTPEGFEPDIFNMINDYVRSEQPNTDFDLGNKINLAEESDFANIEPEVRNVLNGVLVHINMNGKFDNRDYYYINVLPDLIDQIDENAEYAIGNIILDIRDRTHLEGDLISVKHDYVARHIPEVTSRAL